MTRVAFVKTQDRVAGVQKALDLMEINSMKGRDLFLKPNWNSADATPGSTHNDALSTLVQRLQQEQIARAVELGLGVDGPEKIELITDDADSQAYAAQIQEILLGQRGR